VKTLVFSLRSKNPKLFETPTSYTLLSLKYKEVSSDIHHREIEIYSDLIKPADYSAYRDGTHSKIIIGTTIAALLLIAICIYSIIRFNKIRREGGLHRGEIVIKF
jgi:hypothetical protein